MAKKTPGHGKQHVAAKSPAARKPAQQTHSGGKGVSSKHSGSGKHKSTAAKHHPAKTKRTLALGEAVGCCAAEALAASLRLAGWPVSDADVLALYWHTADDADAGASIWETLAAAAEFGLAGARPIYVSETYVSDTSGLILGIDLPGPHTVTVDADGEQWWSWGERYHPATWPDAVIEEAWAVTWQ